MFFHQMRTIAVGADRYILHVVIPVENTRNCREIFPQCRVTSCQGKLKKGFHAFGNFLDFFQCKLIELNIRFSPKETMVAAGIALGGNEKNKIHGIGFFLEKQIFHR
jgi:hypothetical protein